MVIFTDTSIHQQAAALSMIKVFFREMKQEATANEDMENPSETNTSLTLHLFQQLVETIVQPEITFHFSRLGCFCASMSRSVNTPRHFLLLRTEI